MTNQTPKECAAANFASAVSDWGSSTTLEGSLWAGRENVEDSLPAEDHREAFDHYDALIKRDFPALWETAFK